MVFHRRQPSQHIGQVFLRIDPAPPAALNDRVNDGGAPPRVRMSDERARKLAEDLTAAEVTFPGTNLRLIYELVSA